MKRLLSFCLCLIVFACLLAGCTGPLPDEESTGTVTVTDHNGNTVTVPTPIERIAVCDIFPLPSVLAVFFDSADKIVAMAPTSMSSAKSGLLSDLYPSIVNADTSAISGSDVNTEELMKTDPQIVFYNADNAALGNSLTKAGFNAIAISVNNWAYNAVETLNQWIELLSALFPEAADGRAAVVRERSEQTMAFVRERTDDLIDAERKRLFFLIQYSESTIVTSGQNGFGQWWADAIGAVNAASELTGNNSEKVTLEQVYAWDPEMIMMTNFNTALPAQLYQNEIGNYDWSGIKAITERQVYKMPMGMYRSYTPGIDTPITLLWLAKTVYPDRFADVDITAETVNYYQSLFGITLTPQQADRIFFIG